MFSLPPMPQWHNLHPLVVHFPIVLLMIAPLFIVAALVFRKQAKTLMVIALVLMVLGVVSAYISVGSGEAAGELADRNPAVNAVLEHHEELAETTAAVFLVLAIVFAGFLIVPNLLKRALPQKLIYGFSVVFLLVYMFGVLMLVNTAHNGGRLVHQLGVHSIMPPEPLPSEGDSDGDHV